MNQPEFNFTTELKNKVNNTTTKIAKKPLMKTAFLAIILGLAIGVGFSTFNYGIKSIGEYREQLSSNEKELLNLNIQKIKEISPQEFQQFTFYLKDNAKIYDDLAFLAKDSLVKAENENYDMTTSVKQNTKFINDKQTEFKINIENVINTSSTLYSTIQKNSLLNLDNDNIDLFLKYYHNYKSQIYPNSHKTSSFMTGM